MADVFDFYVQDNRKITFEIAEPIMREDNGVTDFQFHVPKALNGLDMTGWAWWFVFVNAKGNKYTEPLLLSDDPERPLEYSVGTYTVDYGMSIKAGNVSFALEAINSDAGGTILNEWHTFTYQTTVKETLQGNQVDYDETQSDIISALIVQIQQKYNALVGGATPIPVASVSQMTDTAKVYLNTTDKNWYYYNSDSSTWVSGGQYASGIVIDPTLTQSGQAADAKVVGDEIDDLKSEIDEIRIAAGVNIFNIDSVHANGITRSGESLIGTARNFYLAYNSTAIPIAGEVGKRYVLSLTAVSDGSDTTTGSGIEVRFKYSDNTYASAFVIPNSTTTAQKFKDTSSTTKQLVGLYITYGSGKNNVWTLSNISIEEFPGLSDYEPYYTAYDRTAREKALSIHEAYDMASEAFYTLKPYNFQNLTFDAQTGFIPVTKRILAAVPCHPGDYIEINPNGLYVSTMIIPSLDATTLSDYEDWSGQVRTLQISKSGYCVILVATAATEGASSTIMPSDYACSIKVHNTYAERLLLRDIINKERTFNLFDSNLLTDGTDWVENSDGSFSGTLTKLNQKYGSATDGFPFPESFEVNTRYTVSAFVKMSGNTYGNGVFVDAYYTNGTNSRFFYVPNTTSDYAFFSGISDRNKTISKICLSYGSNGSNVCYILKMQVQKGVQATYYAPYTNYIDYISRHGNLKYDVPQYWDSAISVALGKIKTNERTIGQNLVEFFFITDTHWNSNAGHSGELLGYLAEKSEIRTVIHGGDFYDGEETSVADAYDKLWWVCEAFNKPIFKLHSTAGNHDNNSPSDYLLTKSQLYSALHRRNEPDETILNGGSVSYFDNPNQKVRFIQLQTIWEITADDRTTAAALINELDSSWTVVVYSHMYWTGYDSSNNPVINSAMTDAGQWLSVLKESASANIACWIVGHMHKDDDTTIGNLLVIATTTDNVGQSGYSGYTMTRNTDTEQAFDCYQIDTSNKVIHITRIGAGNDRQFSYT